MFYFYLHPFRFIFSSILFIVSNVSCSLLRIRVGNGRCSVGADRVEVLCLSQQDAIISGLHCSHTNGFALNRSSEANHVRGTLLNQTRPEILALQRPGSHKGERGNDGDYGIPPSGCAVPHTEMHGSNSARSGLLLVYFVAFVIRTSNMRPVCNVGYL